MLNTRQNWLASHCQSTMQSYCLYLCRRIITEILLVNLLLGIQGSTYWVSYQLPWNSLTPFRSTSGLIPYLSSPCPNVRPSQSWLQSCLFSRPIFDRYRYLSFLPFLKPKYCQKLDCKLKLYKSQFLDSKSIRAMRILSFLYKYSSFICTHFAQIHHWQLNLRSKLQSIAFQSEIFWKSRFDVADQLVHLLDRIQ